MQQFWMSCTRFGSDLVCCSVAMEFSASSAAEECANSAGLLVIIPEKHDEERDPSGSGASPTSENRTTGRKATAAGSADPAAAPRSPSSDRSTEVGPPPLPPNATAIQQGPSKASGVANPKSSKVKAAAAKSAGGAASTAAAARKVVSFELDGVTVGVKVCVTTLLFETESVLRLIKRWLWLETDICDPDSLGRIVVSKVNCRRSNPHRLNYFQSLWTRPYLSWKSVNIILHREVLDQALRDTLNSYVPFADGRASAAAAQAPSKASVVSRRDYSLERDRIRMLDVDVPFLVSEGCVYLDLLASFALLGQLRLPLTNEWEAVDKVLLNKGLSQKDAFRRRNKSTVKQPAAPAAAVEGCQRPASAAGSGADNGRKGTSMRQSHISLRAVKVLAQSDLVENDARKRALIALFEHVQGEIDRVHARRDQLVGRIKVLLGGTSGRSGGSELSSEVEVG